MKIMPCPLNGPRNIQEFICAGPVEPHPDPNRCSDDEWTAFVWMEENLAGVVREWWCHVATSYWFIAERDTVADEILATYPARPGLLGARHLSSRSSRRRRLHPHPPKPNRSRRRKPRRHRSQRRRLHRLKLHQVRQRRTRRWRRRPHQCPSRNPNRPRPVPEEPAPASTDEAAEPADNGCRSRRGHRSGIRGTTRRRTRRLPTTRRPTSRRIPPHDGAPAGARGPAARP